MKALQEFLTSGGLMGNLIWIGGVFVVVILIVKFVFKDKWLNKK